MTTNDPITNDPHLGDLVARYPALAPHAAEVARAFDLMRDRIARGGKILLCGNGGSAADCSHIAGELLKSLARRRPLRPELLARFGGEDADLAAHLEGAIPALSLCDQGVIQSAFANDVGADYTFAQLTLALGAPGDVLWGISTSGNSRNVLNAMRLARRAGIATLGLLGRDGGAILPHCDAAIIAPGANTQQIQEHHLPIYHALCLMLEDAFFPGGAAGRA